MDFREYKANGGTLPWKILEHLKKKKLVEEPMDFTDHDRLKFLEAIFRDRTIMRSMAAKIPKGQRMTFLEHADKTKWEQLTLDYSISSRLRWVKNLILKCSAMRSKGGSNSPSQPSTRRDS